MVYGRELRANLRSKEELYVIEQLRYSRTELFCDGIYRSQLLFEI
jgi:hypothetical protein